MFRKVNKHVIAMCPRRIRDRFSLVFSNFHILPSSLGDSGNFVQTLKMPLKVCTEFYSASGDYVYKSFGHCVTRRCPSYVKKSRPRKREKRP